MNSSTEKVVATDASDLGPAIYYADKYYIVPPISELGYIDKILKICKNEKISGALSLIDPELGLLAKNEELFKEVGTTIVGSSYELCEMSLDKMQMYEWLRTHGYNCARSWMDKEEFYEAVRAGEVVSIFTKKKIKMRAGETDKAVSFKDPDLFALIEKFAKEAGFQGQIDIDLLRIGEQYYISEVNPRFGGGYPHAYEAGCDHMKLILNNLKGIINKKKIGAYEEDVYMMKYNEVKIIEKKQT